MEKEEKQEKEPRKVSTKLAVGIMAGTVVVIIAGCGIAYNVLNKKPQEKMQQKNQANYIGGNNIVNNSISDILEDTNTVAASENAIEENTVVEETKQEEAEKQEETEKAKEEQKQESTTTEKKTETKKEENKKTEKQENTSTAKQEETKPETPKKEETPVKKEPTVVDTMEEEKLTSTETKYGIKTNTYTITTYDVYSDGTKKEKSTRTRTEKDKNSKYSATTAELLPEARQLKSKNASLINGVLGYVNQYREEAGVAKITLDSKLTELACARTIEMAYGTGMSHTRPNGSSCFTILDDASVSYWACGENVACGQSSAKSVSNSWKNSKGHYANMINAGFGKIGIGVIKYDGTYYWCQLFTN